jgi:hypothetical protein
MSIYVPSFGHEPNEQYTITAGGSGPMPETKRPFHLQEQISHDVVGALPNCGFSEASQAPSPGQGVYPGRSRAEIQALRNDDPIKELTAFAGIKRWDQTAALKLVASVSRSQGIDVGFLTEATGLRNLLACTSCRWRPPQRSPEPKQQARLGVVPLLGQSTTDPENPKIYKWLFQGILPG